MTDRRGGYRRLFRLGLGRDGSAEREMDEEIEAHLALRAADLVRAGMTPEAARAEANRRFAADGVDSARRRLRREARRRVVSTDWRRRLEALAGDLRLALRQIRTERGFAAVTVATFGLGIGITTATFTLVRSVLVRPLPLTDPDRLVTLEGVDSIGNRVVVVSAGNWLDWRRESRSLQATALHMPKRYAVRTDGEARRVPTELVTPGYFAMLGTAWSTGRSFTEAEVEAGNRVAVVSQRFWREWLASDSTLGRPVTIEGQSYRIVGVVRRGAEFPAGTDLWVPFRPEPEHGAMRNNINWFALGRLAPDVSLAQATAELSGIARRIRAAEPEALYSYGVVGRPLQQVVVGDARTYLLLLMVSVLLVLLVACLNLAAAHLARVTRRSRETAVRAALGASVGRLRQQIAVEHGLLAVLGGSLGLLLAWAGVGVVIGRWGSEIPRADEVRLDPVVVLFAVAISAAAGLLTGLGPARLAGKPFLSRLIAAGGRGQVRGGRGLPGAPFLVIEVAMALLLLTGAGLLVRSLRVLVSRDLGFSTEVVTAGVTLSGEGYWRDPPRMIGYWDALLGTLGQIPGVTAVGAANWIPLESMVGTGLLEAEGASAGSCVEAGYRAVTEGYHRALAVPLVAGRWFGPEDGATGERVVLVNQRAAAACWPGDSPLGKRIRARSFEDYYSGGSAPWLTVVGVVGDVRQYGADFEPRPEMYVLVRQIPQYAFGMTAIVRGTGDLGRLAAAVRSRGRTIDPSLAIEIGTLRGEVGRGLSARRLVVVILSTFGGLAVALTAVGLFGVLSYSMAQRERELALRAALGASRSALVRTAVASGLGVVALGAGLGGAAAAGLTRYLRSMLVEVQPLDPVAVGWASTVLAVVAVVAVVAPALRATRLDPAIALQAE